MQLEDRPVADGAFELVEQRRFGELLARAQEDPSTLLQLVRDAGVAGAVSYTAVELTFFAIALPVGYISWHASTGEWLQPLLLLQEDGVEGKAQLLGLLLSYIVLLKTFFPLRLGSTLLLTPYTKRLLGKLQLPAFARRRLLKDTLRSLASDSRRGIDDFSTADQALFDQTLAELSTLNPTENPARSPLFSGEWEPLWTTEKELNFFVDKGLFGLPWERTYQKIDIAGGTLENVIQFEDGSLKVKSTISPDAEQGQRFNFAFNEATVRYRKIELSLPPVGKGWGELLFLDNELRIQRDIRGDLLIAERVVVG